MISMGINIGAQGLELGSLASLNKTISLLYAVCLLFKRASYIEVAEYINWTIFKNHTISLIVGIVNLLLCIQSRYLWSKILCPVWSGCCAAQQIRAWSNFLPKLTFVWNLKSSFGFVHWNVSITMMGGMFGKINDRVSLSWCSRQFEVIESFWLRFDKGS